MNESSKTIITKRLLITPFSEKHLTTRYVGWLNNSTLMRYSEQRHKTHTLEMCKLYWHSFNNTPNLLWAIEDILNGYGHIGNISAYVDPYNKIADIGIIVGEANVRGYGYEAFKGVSEYLFENMEIRKITAGTVSANLPMIKIMKKMKMREDGIRNRQYLIEGEEMDIIHMALFKQDLSNE